MFESIQPTELSDRDLNDSLLYCAEESQYWLNPPSSDGIEVDSAVAKEIAAAFNILGERLKAERERRAKMHAAAVTIQKAVRGFLVRRQLHRMKNSYTMLSGGGGPLQLSATGRQRLLEKARVRLVAAMGSSYAQSAAFFFPAALDGVLVRLDAFSNDLEKWSRLGATAQQSVIDKVPADTKHGLRILKRDIELERARRESAKAAKTVVADSDLTNDKIASKILRSQVHKGVTVPEELLATINGRKILFEGRGSAAPPMSKHLFEYLDLYVRPSAYDALAYIRSLLGALATQPKVQLNAYAKSGEKLFCKLDSSLAGGTDGGWEFILKVPPRAHPINCDIICYHALPKWLNAFWTPKKHA
jgi:hypothetical protein